MKKCVLLIIGALMFMSTQAYAPVFPDQDSCIIQKYENSAFTIRQNKIGTKLATIANDTVYKYIMASPFVQNLEVNKRLFELADTLQSDPVDLIAVIYAESELNPTATNALSGAYGLIQWMPKTAKHLGISIEELKCMSILEQLDEVERYYKGTGKVAKIDGFMDLYLAVFWPAAVGLGPDYVIHKNSGTKWEMLKYSQNKGVDMNKDGKITSKDLAEFGISRLNI